MPKANNQSKPWSYSYSTAIKPAEVVSGVVAEPIHRIGPEGVCSGISLREHPRACIEEVKKICLHYVDKCSGKYENNQVAARYVHQLADEVIKQLDGVSAQIQWHEQEPKIFETLLKEWNHFFPPALGAHGTPRAIHLKLNSQGRELESLRSQLDHLNSIRKNDINDIMKSVDCQIQAARVSGIYERKSMLHTHDQQKESYEKIISQLHGEFAQKFQNITEKHRQDAMQQQLLHDDEVKKLRATITKLSSEFDAYRTHTANEATNREKQHEDEKIRLQADIDGLSKTMNIMQKDMDRLLNDDESDSVSSGADASLDTSLDSSEVTEPTDRSQSKIKSQRTKASRRTDVNDQLSMKTVAGSVETVSTGNSKTLLDTIDSKKPTPAARYQQRMKALKMELIAAVDRADKLEAQLHATTSERDFLQRSVEGLQEMNDEMRLALTSTVTMRDGKKVSQAPFVLAHTPHFLGYDRSGLSSSNPKLSAYRNAGVF